MNNFTFIEKNYYQLRGQFIVWGLNHYSISSSQLEEIFQDSCVQVHDHFRTGQVTELNCTVKTYLFAIGKNKILYLLHQEARHKRFIENYIPDQAYDLSLYPEKVDSKELLHKKLDKALADLPESQRKVIQLFYFQKMSLEQLADSLNLKNSNTAKTRKHKCMKELKRRVHAPSVSNYNQ